MKNAEANTAILPRRCEISDPLFLPRTSQSLLRLFRLQFPRQQMRYPPHLSWPNWIQTKFVLS
jgi:hypothetical protein